MIGNKGRRQDLCVDVLNLRCWWHVPGRCWEEGSGVPQSRVGEMGQSCWTLDAENVGGISMQLVFKPWPKWDHLGAQEEGPSVQSLRSPTFRGLVEGKEQGRRVETECAVTRRPRGHSPGWAPTEAREGPFRFGNEATLTLDNLGGVIGLEVKLGWASSLRVIRFKISYEGHFGANWEIWK